MQCLGQRVLAAEMRRRAEIAEGAGDPDIVAEVPPDRQALLLVAPLRVVIGLHRGELAGPVKRDGTQPRVRIGAHGGQRRVERGAGERDRPAHQPERCQGPGQRQGLPGIRSGQRRGVFGRSGGLPRVRAGAGPGRRYTPAVRAGVRPGRRHAPREGCAGTGSGWRKAPFQACPEVVPVGFEQVQPGSLVRPGQVGLPGQVEQPGHVAAVHRRGLPGGRQPAKRVLVDRFEHAVAHAAGPLLGCQQRPVDQCGDGLEHHLQRQRVVRADRLDRVDGAPTCEDRHPAEAHLLGLAEQVVAPLDGRFQGPVPRQPGPAAAGEQPEPVAEPGGQLRHRQRADPGRRELNGQRDAVELAADVSHRRDVLLGQAETGPGQRGTVAEQPDRLRLGRGARIGHLRLRHR